MTSNGRPDSQAPRRPYKAPRLRRLGSVRELTLGATSGGGMDVFGGKGGKGGKG
ncbi:MAG: hypothetical protein K0S65_648 [Labilithrix sp.]|nr:hypothetical protein [Labilithrix sp.]